MGGCRCVYRSCQSSTNQSPGLHYFHFPVKDKDRCEQWIVNARKPMLRTIPKDRLRNKVICSLHFEEKCFTNERKDRLIHSAVPTLGFEDEPVNYTPFTNSVEVDYSDDNNIMLIPTNDDNTKFSLPDVGFAGMSYTIYDDAVIPTSNLPLVMSEEQNKSKVSIIVKKRPADNVETKQKRQKFTVTSINKIKTPITIKPSNEPIIVNEIEKDKFFEMNHGSNTMSYSVIACGDDLTLEPSKISNLDEEICSFTIDSQNSAPLLDNNVSLTQKSNNEFTMQVFPTTIENKVEQENIETIASYEEIDQTEYIVSTPPPENTPKHDPVDNKEEFCKTPEKEYIKMIKDNSKQIRFLKKRINKQSQMNRNLLMRQQMWKYKHRQRFNKYKLLNQLKDLVKPSLMAILKFELLPTEDVVLTDNEEKFLNDLYIENTECYNLLLKKYKWNLPHIEENGN